MAADKKILEQIDSLQKTVKILVFIVLLLFLATGALFYKDYVRSGETDRAAAAAQANGEPQEQFPLLEEYPKLEKSDHVRGNPNAKYLLIEYSDYECPFCKRFDATVKQLMEENKDLAYVYRHYPLDSLHSQARDEAIAAECVARLGGEDAFWVFNDIIYEVTPSNDGLNLAELPKYAENAGVSAAEFMACYENKETKNIVEEQFQSGVKYGINGTPGSFLINTKAKKAVLIPGALPIEQIRLALEKIQ